MKKLKLGASKCYNIHVGGESKSKCYELLAGDNKVQTKENFKYLGDEICNTLSNKKTVKQKEE